MLSKTYRDYLEIAVLFCFSLLLFTWGLSSQEIISFDSRFYLFALEMWRHGPSWFPTTYGEPYPDYPATSTFLIYLVATLYGGMNKLVAVLPSAIAASITIVMTYLLGSLQSKRWGLYSVFFLLMTIAFLKNARGIALDMYPTMITAICFYLVYSADMNNKPGREVWIYPLFLLGFAFRGPIGLVVPTGVVCVYYLLDRNIKKLLITGLTALFLLIISTVVLFALAYHVGGKMFLQDVLRMQIAGRIDSHAMPFYFYFVTAIGNYAISFPLACLVLLGMAYYSNIPNKALLLKLFGWMIIILIGMSIPGDKKTRYILPMVPAIALLASYPFAFLSNKKYFYYLHAIGIRIFLYLPAILLLLVEVVYFYLQKNGLTVDIHYLFVVIILALLQFASIWLVFRYMDQPIMQDTTILFIATVSFALAYVAVMEHLELYTNRARDFIVTVETERLKQHAQLVFYKISPDGLPIKYLISMPNEEQPLFIDNQQALIQFSKPAFFVTTVTNFNALPRQLSSQFEIIAHDKVAHINVVVIKRIK